MIHRSYRDNDTGAPYGWTYVGSHNLSATAWGLPFGDGRLLQCASYELGVVMLVSTRAGRTYVVHVHMHSNRGMWAPTAAGWKHTRAVEMFTHIGRDTQVGVSL